MTCRCLDGGKRLARHELAEACVLEAGWAELLTSDGAGDTLHIHRNQDLQPASLRVLSARRRDGCDG
jgi:hypothetical protein